ncbi:hypothetical protein [Arenimonas aestuarii]
MNANPYARTQRGRGLVREFLVVMLGVLVALALEQWLSDWQEAQRADDTLLAMQEELRDFAVVLRPRLAASPCVVQRLQDLEAHLSLQDPLPAVEAVGRTPYLFSSRSGWRGGAPELLSRHQGPRQAQVYGEIYQGMEEFALLSKQEQANWARLQTLQTPEGTVDGSRRWRLREEIASARNANLLLTAIADQMLERLTSLDVDVDGEPPLVDMQQRAVCQPMSLVGA